MASALFALFLTPLFQEDPLDTTPGPKIVQMARASFSRRPSATRDIIRDANKGEKVTVVSYEGSFAKVTLEDGTQAYIARRALIPQATYKPAPANEEEMMKMKAQGYEAGRFDPETEKKYKEDKGPEMQKAYQQLDDLEKRPEYAVRRSDLARKLEDFRRKGKLGEFSPVK